MGRLRPPHAHSSGTVNPNRACGLGRADHELADRADRDDELLHSSPCGVSVMKPKPGSGEISETETARRPRARPRRPPASSPCLRANSATRRCRRSTSWSSGPAAPGSQRSGTANEYTFPHAIRWCHAPRRSVDRRRRADVLGRGERRLSRPQRAHRVRRVRPRPRQRGLGADDRDRPSRRNGRRALTRPTRTSGDFDPAWSPDGRRIAYVHSTGSTVGPGQSGTEIWVMNADGSGKRRLTRNVSFDGGPTWSPTAAASSSSAARSTRTEAACPTPTSGS